MAYFNWNCYQYMENIFIFFANKGGEGISPSLVLSRGGLEPPSPPGRNPDAANISRFTVTVI